MSNLIPLPEASSGLTRSTRRASRQIDRMNSGSLVRVAGVDTETELALTRADATTAVTGHLMGDIVRVAQAQRHLEQLAPEASHRLAMIADNHALGLMDIEADHRRSLRRI